MPSGGNSLTVAPDSRELEVSVFGPGFGEAIVVHLGDGRWAVVDCCLDASSKQPAPLQYLSGIGADPVKSIQLVIATHWHDDHIDGLSAVFERAVEAAFVCTGAIQRPVLDEILAAWTGSRFLPGGSGVDELRSIMTELKNRRDGARHVAPKLACAGKSLWPIPSKPNPLLMSIRCLSPSDSAILATTSRLFSAVAESAKTRRRLPNLEENDTSVVLSVEAAGHRVLLGGDLHVRADRSFGWLAVVDELADENTRHHAFKVPHHGSPTSDHEEIWTKLATNQAYAVTTPFVGGRVRLPSVPDCERILSRTSNAFLSAPPVPARYRDSDKTVEKTVLEVTRFVQLVPGKFGQVRLRKHVDEPSDTPWRVELFGSALSMSDYVRVAK